MSKTPKPRCPLACFQYAVITYHGNRFVIRYCASMHWQKVHKFFLLRMEIIIAKQALFWDSLKTLMKFSRATRNALVCTGKARTWKSKSYMLKAVWMLGLGVATLPAAMSKLEAISMIESGNNDRAVGGAGEVSRYQIKPLIWRQYSRSWAYSDVTISTWVAEQHLHYLENEFRHKTGRNATDFDIYVMWNGGLAYYAHLGFNASAVKSVIRERARRYVNLRTEEPMLVRKSALVAMAPRVEMKSRF
jgi:hypothetical protein